MASWPMLPYTSSPHQLSSLVKVGSAFFLVQACLLCGASPLGPVGLARAKKFQVGTMDVDRAASLEILTSTKLILPCHGSCSISTVQQLPSGLGLQAWSSKILTLDILSRSPLGPCSMNRF